MVEKNKEEKKEEVKKEEVVAASPAPEAKPTVDAKATASDVKPAVDAKPAAPAAKITKEKPANCAGCNKSVKKKRWYYRDGKFYCTKRCWITASKKEAKPEEGDKAQK